MLNWNYMNRIRDRLLLGVVLSSMLIIGVFYLSIGSALACERDSECGSSYICKIPNGQRYGICQCRWGNFEVGLPGFPEGTVCEYIESWGAENTLFYFINSLIIIIFVITIMAVLISVVVGGYIYMTAGGSSDRVHTAKLWISSALIGLTIALISWVLLSTISSSLVIF